MALTSVDITLESIKTALNIPLGYVKQTLYGLFDIPVGTPITDTVAFFEADTENGVVTSARKVYNSTNITIGLHANECDFTEAGITAYIVKSRQAFVDNAPWVTA